MSSIGITMPTKKGSKESDPISLTEFLESVPPNQTVHISDLVEEKYYPSHGVFRGKVERPELQLHCTNESCNGLRFFRTVDQQSPVVSSTMSFFFLTYRCSNCRNTIKTYAIGATILNDSEKDGYAFKFGESPVFGPPTPARLITLIGSDRDDFLKGRRCENKGLGIGAFTYYRRVVENQKNRIISEIMKVAEKLNAHHTAIEELQAAISEKQFSKALQMVKAAMPQSLLINGQNPLALLHSALSDGIHDRSDEECLETASSVRIVLAELSERIALALKDEAGLAKAVTTLMKRRNDK